MTNLKKTDVLQTNDPFLEQKKNELLVAVYDNHYEAFEKIYKDILKHAQSKSEFSENTEKLLNQIQTLFKKFKPALLKNCTPSIKETNNRLKDLILFSIKKLSGNIIHINFSTWETNLDLNHQQKGLLYKTAMTFQLTSGCSNYCRRCNEWALPGVRSHFSHHAVLKILKQMADQGNDEISLYGASDPLDWEENEKTISDIIDYLDTLKLEYSLLTKVPKTKESLLKTLLKKHSNLSVSITSKNKARIKKIEQDFENPISKQHDLEELLIPAGLDEDFVTINPSITDGYGVEVTPDGAFIIIPTFTSALHPFGHKKIQVTSKTNFFPIKKTGRKALLVDYFKPIEGYDLKQKPYYLDYLLDVQIESIILDNGEYELTPPGMRSLKEYLFIFEEKPRIQRKKMTLSVLKRLKRQFVLTTGFKKLSTQNKDLYIKKIKAHLNLCKKANCRSLKLFAISFFLESISNYVLKNPIKTKMMQFLLKDEKKLVFKTLTKKISHASPEDLLISPDIDSFYIFRFYIFSLMNKSNDTNANDTNNSAILKFIKAYPSVYDPVADIFTHH
ncbi:MAG: hypothetical protein HN417_02695 [Desulfobacula sp.]|jgi:hypothetical protein|nr:hypothetical protein [Desulfobacula sp.]